MHTQQCFAFKKIIFFFFILFLVSGSVYSRGEDTLVKDSLKIYKKIKKLANKNAFTRWAYNAIFVDPEPPSVSETVSKRKLKNINPYLDYENKPIRNVNIIVFDPFGFSVTDTTPRKVNSIQRAANFAHVKSRQWMINNRLLFKKNDTLNPITLSETERLLRATVFVNDARVTVTPVKNSDSVDVNVFVHDKWTVTAPVLITEQSGSVRLRNQNLLGLGQQFEQLVGYTRPDIFEYSGYYAIDNIDNTYISSRISYQSVITHTQVGVSFDRGFYSPLAPWAAGISLTNTWSYYGYSHPVDSTPQRMMMDAFNGDVWLGRAIKLSPEKTFFSQSTNLILGMRYYKNHYLKRPSLAIDTGRTVFNTAAFIGNVGFAIQQYYKDRFIYRFGANEDVPEGLILQYIYGGIKKEFNKIRYYSGIEIARAKHFNFGYVSATYAYGVFFNKEVANDITSQLKLYYFSDAKRIKRWYLRQFVYLHYVYGANKLFGETTTLSGSELYGFSPGSLAGTTKAVVNSETVAYAPYKVIGFKFAPVLMMGFGMVGDSKHLLYKSNLYQGYSLGLMIRNENLVSSTFQFSFGYYPFLPDGSNSVLTYNPVTSFTLRVRAFAVSKPEFVSY